jgi:hypothetical protein
LSCYEPFTALQLDFAMLEQLEKRKEDNFNNLNPRDIFLKEMNTRQVISWFGRPL